MTFGSTADGIRCMLMRGGTSKGAFFLADDLPADPTRRDELLLRIVGSPDPRQIDGVGGAHPLTTKVAVVGPSAHPGADVDYLFLQPSVDQPQMSDTQNCGNMLAAVGPFAVERGLVSGGGSGDDHPTSVRIRMVNTNSMAVATFPLTAAGAPRYHGSTAISGVPGTAAPVELAFEDLAGGSCGALFPSGAAVDDIDGVACTLVDCGMPVVVIAARELGVVGTEDCATLEANRRLRDRLEHIRLKAGRRMNLGDVAETTVPKLTMVSPPLDGATVSTRTFIPHRCHDAIGVLGALSVAVAVLVGDTPAAAVARTSVPERGEAGNGDGPVRHCRLEHPSGIFDTKLALSGSGAATTVTRAAIIRTARKLMDGTVYPREYP